MMSRTDAALHTFVNYLASHPRLTTAGLLAWCLLTAWIFP